ncbi:MAG: NAD(P)H-binding protein [Proteobacteria bacterium]|nr:NAD(P)H-binding protein [Pseudomonadota bacterium]
MAPLALTGATGFVGQALLDLAGARGLPVRALARRPQPPRAGVDWVAGDLADAGALARLCSGAAAVIHVAGVVNAPDPAGFEAGNVAGTAAVLAAAQGAGVRRFVHVSSLSAREPGLSAYGASKARAEALVRAAPLEWAMVRPPWIYGPRDADSLELFRMARLGFVPAPYGRASLLHVDDLARLLLALAASSISGALYEADDGQPGGWDHAAIAGMIGAAVRGEGARVWVPRLAPGLLHALARGDRLVRGAAARLTPDRAAYMSHPDWVCSPAAGVPVDLWRPEVPSPDGLAATAQWYRGAGWL